MTRRVSTRAAADGDISEASDWYERQRPGLGDEFLAAVADVFLRLEEVAEQFPIYYRGFRRALTERFPYKIFFRIEGDAVIVFRVRESHGPRGPSAGAPHFAQAFCDTGPIPLAYPPCLPSSDRGCFSMCDQDGPLPPGRCRKAAP